MKKLILLLILFSLTTNLTAQNLTLRGRILSKETNDPLIGANVVVYHLPDSAISGSTTDNNGRFIIENLRSGRYAFNVRFIGYKTYKEVIELEGKSLSLGQINLEISTIETDEVKVVEQAIPVIQKQDTTEFSAQAFKTHKDADAENLISKMPGITVQDGKVQAHGEDVKKVLIDGKQFFGDDPSAALKNIPAEIIDRIQIFDQQSEQSQFTGFDDGNTNKTINLITRFRNIKGTFGKFIAGYGDQEKYKSVGNVNFFNGDRRLTLLGQINNVNEQNFSIEDLVGSMPMGGGSSGRMNMFRMAGSFGGGNFQGRAGGISDFLVSARNGLTDTKAFGINYSNKWDETLELSGSYFFNLTNNNAISNLSREYFLANGQQNYDESSLASSDNLNHRLNMRFEYKIDTMNSILVRPRLTVQQNIGKSSTFGNTASTLASINSQSTNFNSNLTAINSSAEILFRHKFETKRRTVSLSLNPSYNSNQGDNKLFSEYLFFMPNEEAAYIDQHSNLDVDGSGISGNLVYTEPFMESSMLQFTGNFSTNLDKSNQKTYLPNTIHSEYNILSDSLSNVYEKRYNTKSAGFGYRHQKEGFAVDANLNYNIATLTSNQTYPFSAEVSKSFYSFLPSLMLRYSVNRDNNFRLFLRTSNNSPSVEQLQNVLNNTNPQQLSIGNPNLKQDYRTTLSFRYQSANIQSMSSFFIMFSGTITNNYIGYQNLIAARDTLIEGYEIKRGVQLRQPLNLDGYLNAFSFMTYGFPAAFIYSNINLNAGFNYSKTPSLINSAKNFSNNFRYSLGFTISSNFSPDIDFSISSMSSYNVITNTIQKNSNSNYFNQNTRAKIYLLLWEKLVVQTDANHTYNNGLSSNYDNNFVILNLALGYKLFSKGEGELRLSVIDLLNQNSNVQRNTYDYYVEDSRSNVLGRYFLLSFIYNLRAFN